MKINAGEIRVGMLLEYKSDLWQVLKTQHVKPGKGGAFAQVEIKKEIVGEQGKLLTENLEVTVSFYNENPISIELPNQIKCKIETTDVALKGQTVSSSYKPATLDNGLNIQVPPFIESGDEVIVDTRSLEYIKKV